MAMCAAASLTPEQIREWTWREFLIYYQTKIIERRDFESVLFAAIINAGGPNKPVEPSELNPLESAAGRHVQRISKVEDLIRVVTKFYERRRE